MPKRYVTLKDPRREKQLFNQRVVAVGIGITLLVLLLIVRLIYLQIIQEHRYTTLARQNQLNVSPIEPNRGLIYDRTGVLLAENIPVYNLVITPSRANDVKKTVEELKKIILISDNDVHQFRRLLKLHRQFEAIPIRIKLTEEEVARFALDQYRFPGVSIQTEMIRHYPQGAAFAAVVGYVGRINAHELATVDPGNYSTTNFIGKTGAEKFYENKLHGKVGLQQAESNAHGQVVRVLNRTPSTPGNNLYLTIDSKLQIAVQQALGKMRGAVVAIDPNNGEVLALVSNPNFDPNLFVKGISKTDFQQLQNDKNQPLYNRALRGNFAPGSTIKPFIGLGALSANIITPDYTVYDPGWFQLKNSTHIYHGYHHLAHGMVNLAKAIAVSSDIYFYNLAAKMGIDKLAESLTCFGFGQATGIDLPNEAIGVVPTPAWKKQSQGKSWYPGDTIITGIGQGYTLSTPLQLAQAVAAIATRGQHWQPHILFKSQSADGSFDNYQPAASSFITANKKDWDTVIEGMRNVTSANDGTAAPYFRNITYTVAGKTGTAQVFSLKKNQRYNKAMLPERLRDNSLFIAFAPVENPKIAVGIIVQNSAVPAAQIARELLDFYLVKKDISAKEKAQAQVINATDEDETENVTQTDEDAADDEDDTDNN